MAGLCRRSKRRLIALLLVPAILFAGFFVINRSLIDFGISFSEDCEDGLSDGFLSSLCRNYSKKLAYGDICHLICEKTSFKQKGCIHHSGTVVINGVLNGKKIVLKQKKVSSSNYISTESLQAILGAASDSVVGAQLSWEELVLDKVESAVGKFARLDGKNILEQLRAPASRDLHEMAAFLPLAAQDEFAMYGVYQDLQHIPKLYGHCGHSYAVEELTPYSALFPAITKKLSWTNTRKLALSFLEMVIELEGAKGGPLQHCDIQEGNFGVTDDFQVKLIDVDLILTKEKADLFLPQPNCTTDSDCEFFDCVSICDVKTKQCLARRITSNLQVLCRDIFKSNWPSTGLFGRVPQQFHSMLNILLEDCSSKRFGYFQFKHRKVKAMIRSLKAILSRDVSNQRE